jgi:hypothetical protein
MADTTITESTARLAVAATTGLLILHKTVAQLDFNYFTPFTVNAAFGHGDFLANYQRPGIHRFLRISLNSTGTAVSSEK